MMTRRITFSIALVLSILLGSLTSSVSMAQGRENKLFTADTGIQFLGAGQFLRVSMLNRGREEIGVRFVTTAYVQGVCSEGICKHMIASESRSSLFMLNPGEALSMDLGGNAGIAGIRTEMLNNKYPENMRHETRDHNGVVTQSYSSGVPFHPGKRF